jgi:acetyl esterase/lipase
VQVFFLHFVDTLNFLATSDKKFTMLLTESPAKTLSYDYRLPPQYVF